MSIDVKIDAFEGPLDLLLHLITKEEIDIYDIPIVKVTDQYMKTMSQLPDMDLESTTEFLLMASTLLEIKSRMLLPDQISEMDLYEFSGEDPRQELVKRLIEYKKYKDAASLLRDKETALDELVFKDQEELGEYTRDISLAELNENLEVELLNEALKRLLLKLQRFDTHRKTFFKGIKRDVFTVEEKIDFIGTQLSEGECIKFSSLFGEIKTKEEVVVTFLALLELLKMKTISIRQDVLFEDIRIFRRQEDLLEV